MRKVRVALIAALLVGITPLRLGAADVARAADPIATSTLLVNPQESAVVSTEVTYTVAVSPGSDGGTYSFQVDGATVATKPWAEGFTQFKWTFGTKGTHTVQVLFGGTAAYAASASQLAEIDIIPPYPTSVTVQGTPNPAGRNADVVFTATVLPNPGPGDIEWLDQEGVLATTALAGDGSATFTTSFDTAGSTTIWARFTGNDDWSPRTSDPYQELVQGDPVTVAVSVPGSPLSPGPVTANVTLTPNPGAGTLLWRLCEFCGETGLPVDADGTTAIDLGSQPIGVFIVYVRFTGSGNFGEGAGQATFTVADPSVTTLATDRTIGYVGELPVKLTATVSSVQDITGGTVTFFDNVGGNIVQLGPVAVNPVTHQAVYSSSSLRLGSHSVTAKYNGDTLIKVSTSSAVAFTVAADTAVHATFTAPAATFYPYKDGYRDTVNLGGVLSERATVTVRIYTGGGTLVKTFSLGTRNPGAWVVAWAGRNAAGSKVAAGTYTVKVTFKDVKGHTKLSTGKTAVSWRQVVWKSVSVTRYAEAGSYFVSVNGGDIYYSLDYPRGRILDAGPMDGGCTECAFAAGRFGYQLVTSGVLMYRNLALSPRGHGFSDREHTGTLYIEHPTTQEFILPLSLPMYDEAGVTYSIPFTTSALSSTRKLVAWVWMDEAWGDAYDLNFIRLTYQYAVWR